jgi:hypothetical protein
MSLNKDIPPGLMLAMGSKLKNDFGSLAEWGRGGKKKSGAIKILNEDLQVMYEMMKLPDNLSGKNLPLAASKPPPKPQYQLPERLV